MGLLLPFPGRTLNRPIVQFGTTLTSSDAQAQKRPVLCGWRDSNSWIRHPNLSTEQTGTKAQKFSSAAITVRWTLSSTWPGLPFLEKF